MKIAPPNTDEYAPYYGNYIKLIKGNNPVKTLNAQKKQVLKLIGKLNNKQLNYRYAEGKWTIKEVMVHIMDAERVFAYRGLCIARNDQTPLPAFEESEYAPQSKANERKIKSILREYESMRNATMEMFGSFDEEMLMRKGTASNKTISVRALLYLIAGHEMHHLNIIKERYLAKKSG